MSTYEALRFLGLDHYATASDIKAAYRRLASNPHPNADERMEMLNRAYAALHHRVDHTPPEMDTEPGAAVVAESRMKTAGLQMLAAGWRTVEGWKRSAGRLPRLRWERIGLPRVGRLAAVFVVMAAVGYGIVRGAAERRFAPTVVDAETAGAPVAKPMAPAPAVRVEAVEKAQPAREKKPAAAAVRPMRAPALPGVDPVEAKAIDSACLTQTGEDADAYSTCVVQTARETPHAIHLE